MARKKRKGIGIGKQIIIVSCVIALNLVGISYALWNTGTIIESTVSTGYINPVFTTGGRTYSVGTLDLLTNEIVELEIEVDHDAGTVPHKFIGYDVYSYPTNIDISFTGNGIKLTAPEIPGEYTYEVVLRYIQYNGFGWEKDLTIKGGINVTEPLPVLGTDTVGIEKIEFDSGLQEK
ncbi:hypothetical protein [Serpentinicella alkaliphila]|uniref:Uncharacterized protein n=1 Tax=Serpentinicella alkaliphila TaxID=1734049 RepID=A0A4R2TVP5_9FIRM|nr:hypothetical protein [Serpentinicella alkaliphila]QUH25265.1 hypothetical protein HZR23_05460 [Serpentinicella alkaliphila]TCQ07077.1 hypothetical protein EDD79_100273 [Serpentinicella alkaliphila]